jgi:hypothetical protein
MMRQERDAWITMAAVLAAVALLLWYSYRQVEGCKAQGMVAVRGALGFVCVEGRQP